MTEKEQIVAMIERLPDDVRLKDIQYHLYVRRKIKQGLDDIQAGRVFTHAEAGERLRKRYML